MSYAKYGSNIPEFVTRLRLALGLTQEELAVRLGVTKQYVSQVENNKYPDCVKFATMLLDLTPRDRLPYLHDLIIEASQNRTLEKLKAQGKLAVKVKRAPVDKRR